MLENFDIIIETYHEYKKTEEDACKIIFKKNFQLFNDDKLYYTR